jgi:hypothetical protein
MIFFFNGTAHCRVFDSATGQTLVFPKNEIVVVRNGGRVELRNSQTGSIAAFDIADVDALMGMTPANALTLLRPLFFECCAAAPSCCPSFAMQIRVPLPIPTLNRVNVTPTGGGPGTTRTITGEVRFTPNACCAGLFIMEFNKAYIGTNNNSVAFTNFTIVPPPLGWLFFPPNVWTAFECTVIANSNFVTAATHYIFEGFSTCGAPAQDVDCIRVP